MPQQARGARRHSSPPRRSMNPWLLLLPVVAIAIAVIVVVGLTRDRGTSGPPGIGDPVPEDVLAQVSRVPPEVWARVGAKGAQPPTPVTPTSSARSGVPQVLYIGAEYCPYCAGQRWPLVVALSHFGQFRDLKLSASSPSDVYPNTPTFSFRGATYTSQYIKLEAVETAGRVAAGGRYPTLETPTADQNALLRTFDAPPYVPAQNAGAIPFLLINQRYLWVGSSLPIDQLQGKTWQSIAGGLATARDSTSQGIIANANMLTAAICRLTNQEPGDVCGNAGVQAASRALPPPNTP